MEINSPSFQDTFEKLQLFITNTYSFESYSDKVTSLNKNYEKVKMAYKLLEKANLFPKSIATRPKSLKESTSFREKGNKEFLQKKDLLAIQTYSASVAFAPINSEELALAFANRSAVTYHLKQYGTCIKDIDRALAGKYPKHLLYKLYDRKAKCQTHLGMDESAKETIKLALDSLSHSHFDEFKLKSMSASLTEYSNTCSGADRFVETHKKCSPSVSKSGNDIILSASSLVQIDHSPTLGRHLVATADIEPGDTLVIEQPFASVLLPTMYNNHCFHCKKRCHSLIPCLYCVMCMFCNEECRSSCWDHSHRFECSLVPLLVALGFSQNDLMAVRTLLMASKQYKSLEELLSVVSQIESTEINDPRAKGLDENGHYNSADYRTVHHLVNNLEFISNVDVFRVATTAAYIVHLFDRHTDYFTSMCKQSSEPTSDCHANKSQPPDSVKLFIGGLLFHYVMIVHSNAHEMSELVLRRGEKKMDGESFEIGVGLYPVLSLINHSCDPNVVHHSHNGDLMVLTAIKVIAAGEQILDSYGYDHLEEDLTTRQNILYRQFHFSCQCVACRDNWPVYPKLPATNPVFINLRLKDELEKSSKIFRVVQIDIKTGSMEEEKLNLAYAYLSWKEDMKFGSMEEKLRFLCAHLSLMHRTVQRPWKEYSECQEVIKQCLSQQGNHYFAS